MVKSCLVVPVIVKILMEAVELKGAVLNRIPLKVWEVPLKSELLGHGGVPLLVTWWGHYN